MPDDEVALDFQNYPVDGDETAIREQVGFGPASEDFAVLVELNPTGGPLRITVGNGPPHEDAPRLIGQALHDIADAIEDLENTQAYWDALTELTE